MQTSQAKILILINPKTDKDMEQNEISNLQLAEM